MKKAIQQRYDLTADVYDDRYKKIQFEKFKIMLQDLQINGKVLDHGCGTGLFAEFVKSHFFGIDVSFKMLKQAQKRGELVVQGDIEHLPFKSKTFDWILSFTVLQNVQNPRRVLDELKRVCKYKIILTYLNKFDFFAQIQEKFKIQEIRLAGEDIGFVLDPNK